MAQASRALVMLLPTPPLPDTTPITFLTLLLGLGASCCGPCRLGQSSPQLEQSWVHSSLILLFPAPKGGAASCFVKVPAGIPPRGLPSYHTTKGRRIQERRHASRHDGDFVCAVSNGKRVPGCGALFLLRGLKPLAKSRPLPLLRFGCFCRRQRLSYAASRTANPT